MKNGSSSPPLVRKHREEYCANNLRTLFRNALSLFDSLVLEFSDLELKGNYNMIEIRKPIPPFTLETAIQKVQAAEDAWNSCNPEKVSRAYTVDSQWRNRDEFIVGRQQIVKFLTLKWHSELDYRLIKELWSFTDNRIAVRFAYEYHNDSALWFRAYGNENWEFDENGLMRKRYASINDLSIYEEDRKFHWNRSSPRPSDHPSLSDLNL